MELSDIILTLFFTGGVGLKTWVQVGNLDREITIYQRLAEHLKAVNFVTYGGGADYKYADLLGNIGLYPISWRGSMPIKLVRLLIRHWPMLMRSDILKTNQIRGSELPIWLKKYLGKKLIVRCGWLWSLNFERETHNQQAIAKVRSIEKRSFHYADVVVVTTSKNRQHAIDRYGISSKKIRVIPNYVDTERFSNTFVEKTHSDGWQLSYVGRHSSEKNLCNLLNAIAIYEKKSPIPVQLNLYGSGPQSSNLKELADKLRIKVIFWGNVPNSELPKKLNQSDVFVFPSLYENHPKALLEAMSCALPCIGTDVEGIQDEIKHRETGYLCGTDSESIADAIQEVLADKSLQHEMGENARRYIKENYSLERVLRMEIDVIREVMSL